MDASLIDAWASTLNTVLMFVWMGVSLYFMREVKRQDRIIALQCDLIAHLMTYYLVVNQGHVQPEPATEQQEAA